MAADPRSATRVLPRAEIGCDQRNVCRGSGDPRSAAIDPAPAPAPPSFMSTEIIIVNWNNRRETLECLDAVTAQLGETAEATITVVDNGSTDGSTTAIT